ncbi:hypothetical protein SBC1_74820 (plasmid) [Caballeronia sp. SBC1]|nr:hypothetical protein SBC2_71470 [Caballeronia sp. SBC2]QIN67435.1 hypothetical protein SBC1_74820 [Caballeronia sp. SBC1]
MAGEVWSHKSDSCSSVSAADAYLKAYAVKRRQAPQNLPPFVVYALSILDH